MKKIKVSALFTLVFVMLFMLTVSVFAVNYVPEANGSYSLRLEGEKGMRVLADVQRAVADDELATEIGFIATRQFFLDREGMTAEDFTLDSNVKMVRKAAKEIVDGQTVLSYFKATDEIMSFSGVFIGIDEDHYDEIIVAKPYVIYDNTAYYGNAAVKSFADIAHDLADNQEKYNQLDNTQQRAIDDIVRKADGFTETLKNRLVIPKILNGQKPVEVLNEPELVYYVYAYIDGDAKYIPVDTEYSDIVDVERMKLNAEYEAKICTYTVKNGLYCITSVGYALDENGAYIGVEKEDTSYLDYKNPKRTFYFENTSALENLISKEDGKYTVLGYPKKLEIVDGHTQIIVRDEKKLTPFISKCSVEEFLAKDISACNEEYVTFVVSNNIESTESDFVDVIYIENYNGAFENTNPYPVPEIDVNLPENLIIPTTLDGKKPAVDMLTLPEFGGINNWVYAYHNGEENYVNVYTEDVYPSIVDFADKLSAEYEDKLCVYVKDENGVYHIKSLGYALDKDGVYTGLSQDITVLDGEDAENLFYTELYDVKFENVEGNIYDAGFERNLDITDASIIVRTTSEAELLGSVGNSAGGAGGATPIKPTRPGGTSQGDVNIDTDDLFDNDDEDGGVFRNISVELMNTMAENATSISLVVKNNPESNEVEKLVVAYIVADSFEFENCDNGHDYVESDRKEATCEENGYVVYTCARKDCGESYTETLEAFGHNVMPYSVVGATCTEPGEEIFKCNNEGCEYSYSETIPELGHVMKSVKMELPTCTSKGEEVFCCEREGCAYSYVIETPKLNHSFGTEWTVVKEPTCTESGTKSHACVNCGTIEFKVIKAEGHDYIVEYEELPTCLEDGYVDLKCSKSGCGHQKRQQIEATGHSFGDDSICDNCGFTKAAECNHDYVEQIVEPTCTTMGYTQYTCSICGDFHRADYIEQLGHKYVEGEVIEPHSCTTPGRQTFICSRCEESETRIIPAGHTWEISDTIEATCTNDGEFTKTCTGCGMVATEIIKGEHKWEDVRILYGGGCITEGRKECVCTVCGRTDELPIPAKGHQYVNGYCKVCGDYFMDNIVYLEESQRYGMYFSINDIVSDYGPELVDEYGVYLDHNSNANIKKVAVYLTQGGTMWRRAIACTGDNIEFATYVPYLANDGELYYSGLNHGWINIFNLSKNPYGIWEYNNYATIGVNLQDANGNLLLTLSDIGKAGYETQVFDNLNEMKLWLMDGACEHNWKDTGEYDIRPTCTAGGVKIQACTKCNETRKLGVAATGHITGSWYVVTEPTLEDEGLERCDCKNCDEYFITRPIPKLEPEKFDVTKLMLVKSDISGVSMTQTVVKYNPATCKDEHYLECYMDGEIVQLPINPDGFYPSIASCYDDYMDTYYIGDITSFGTNTYVEKLATVVLGTDSRYVIKPVLHVENSKGEYIGINRDATDIYEDSSLLYGNDLGTKKGYLNRNADGTIEIVDVTAGTTLIGDLSGTNKIEHLNLTDDTRIIIKNRAGSKVEYKELTKEDLTSSVATELTNIQYVVTGADAENLSADLLVLYAETKNFAYVMRTVMYNLEPNNEYITESVKDGATITLREKTDITGWVFDGWSIDGVMYNPGDEICVTSDITVIGKYIRAYKVTIINSCCNTRTEEYYSNGDVITLPEAHACDGYRFDAWQITATGSSAVTKQPGQQYTVTANTTIKSLFTRLYDVTYKYGCCGGEEVDQIANGTKLTLAAPEHICEGYVFSNFAIADRSGNLKDYAIGSTVTISKNTTIECVYKRVYTVTVYEYQETPEGLTESGYRQYEVVDGEYFTLPEYPVFNQCRVDTWIVETSEGIQMKDEFDRIPVNEDIEITLDYTQVLTVTFICTHIDNTSEPVIFYYEEGDTVELSQLHEGHDEYFGTWEFCVNDVMYSKDESLIITENLEITCTYLAFPTSVVQFFNVFEDQSTEFVSSNVYVLGDTIEMPAPLNDDYWIFKGWEIDGEDYQSGDIITVYTDMDVYGHYVHVPVYEPDNPDVPEVDVPKEVDTELLEMVSQAREEIRDIRISNTLHKETRQEIVDTVKYVMYDIYEGVDVDSDYVREVYAERIDSIKQKVREEMTEEESSTFANLLLDGVTDNVQNFLADYFGIDLENIKI